MEFSTNSLRGFEGGLQLHCVRKDALPSLQGASRRGSPQLLKPLIKKQIHSIF